VSETARPPSVDALARSLAGTGLPQPMLVEVARAAIAAGDPASALRRAAAAGRSLLQPVINATGVLLHTNLGRAPVPAASDGTRYSNLELDLEDGRRGSRQDRAGPLLARACGAERALVVNNCAAAVVLVLAALARDRDVVVSRGELVEIGGGFRIPEVLAQSGARLVEVGTTNRTRLADYRAAVQAPGADVGLVLKVHASNYRISGFTETVEVAALAGVGPPVVADIGSGLLDAATPWLADGPPPWLANEPAARQTLAGGAALVTFSGDKLLGGPQAGIVAGRADLVAACASHPLARALRPGSLVLGALQETALAYLRRDGAAIGFWRMATLPVADLEARAAALGVGRPVACASVTGGGTLPGVEIPSAGVAVEGDHRAALRARTPPVVARVAEGVTVCDLRTVAPADDAELSAALAAVARP
jgi:L-seryl-tRNA(Ser) seleniumtransferase